VNSYLVIAGYNVAVLIIVVAMFTSLYHLTYNVGTQLEQIEMMSRRTESGTQNIQIRLSLLERVLLNYDHAEPEPEKKK
jgi:hypothetical protein